MALYCTPELINNTIVSNRTTSISSSARGAGIHAYSGSSVTGRNNIVYFNESVSDPECYGIISFGYSCVSTAVSGTGNITGDPMFVDRFSFDFNLQETSPCIDTGDPSSPLDPDDTRADMGALYYNQSPWVGREQSSNLPQEFALYPPVPNPFNSQTILTFRLPKDGQVSLAVYDLQGREVASLVDGWYAAGTYQASFDGVQLPSGIYFACLKLEDFSDGQKLLLLR